MRSRRCDAPSGVATQLRYLDIAVAGLIGMSAISGIAVWSPKSGDAGSRELMMQSELRDHIVSYLQQKGVLWLLRSSPEVVCSGLSNASNSSLTFAAKVGSVSCGSPPTGTVFATLPVELGPTEVVLEAWSTTRA